MSKPSNLKEAQTRLERYCALRDRCQFEVQKKLKDWGIIQEAADEILISLITQGFVSDERFTHAFVRGKFNQNGWGKLKIKSALREKEIPAKMIQEGLDQIDSEQYFRSLTQLAEKKFKEVKGSNAFEKKGKVFRFLAQRGFESSLIYEALNEL
mgnify:CR=1 FL=1